MTQVAAEPTGAEMAERDAAQKELAEFYAWRTRTVNVACRAAHLKGWCSDFERFMRNVGLPGRPAFVNEYGWEVPPGWVCRNGKWFFNPALLPRPEIPTEFETTLERARRERDEALATLKTLTTWREQVLQPEAIYHAHASDAHSDVCDRLIKLVGLRPRVDMPLIDGEFDLPLGVEG